MSYGDIRSFSPAYYLAARDLADCCTDTQADSEFGYAGYCILKLAMH